MVRSYKYLQVPRGLPKTAQVIQDHSNCGFNCGLEISASAGQLDHLRPGRPVPTWLSDWALASSHSPRDGVWLGTSWQLGLGLVRVLNPGFFNHQVCGWPLWLWVKGRVMINRLLLVGCEQEPLQRKADYSSNWLRTVFLRPTAEYFTVLNEAVCPRDNYCKLEYSLLACFKIGMSGSASFHNVRKSRYAAWALAVSPCKA